MFDIRGTSCNQHLGTAMNPAVNVQGPTLKDAYTLTYLHEAAKGFCTILCLDLFVQPPKLSTKKGSVPTQIEKQLQNWRYFSNFEGQKHAEES